MGLWAWGAPHTPLNANTHSPRGHTSHASHDSRPIYRGHTSYDSLRTSSARGPPVRPRLSGVERRERGSRGGARGTVSRVWVDWVCH